MIYISQHFNTGLCTYSVVTCPALLLPSYLLQRQTLLWGLKMFMALKTFMLFPFLKKVADYNLYVLHLLKFHFQSV